MRKRRSVGVKEYEDIVEFLSGQDAPFDKEKWKGDSPHFASCRICGKKYKVIYLGGVSRRITCNSCGHVHYSIATFTNPNSKGCVNHCHHCKRKFQHNRRGKGKAYSVEIIGKDELIPEGYCQKCGKRVDKEKKAFAKEMEKGGVAFRCTGCGSSGMIKAGTEYAKEFRKKHNTPAPKPVSVVLDRCFVCENK